MALLSVHQLAFIFGLLGNIVGFLVFLAPVPTFYTIYKKKSSEGYHSIPYVIALCSAMLLLYYGFLKSDAILIITINSIGCAIEITYIVLYLIFAPEKEKRFTIKLILFFNIGAFSLLMVVVNFLIKPPHRVTAVGWVCAAYNLAVFAAPLSIMRKVIKTKSVEYMPFTLSFFLTLCATTWFFYGFFVKDMFIALPNVLGFLFGIVQMILYMVYKSKQGKQANQKQQDQYTDMKLSSMESPKFYTKEMQMSQDVHRHNNESNANNV
ncbi:Bidirectional sugar transporter SWEET [Melia azedarach]|uniref:Bidirectional sugar transporter SWEET n=1 Tax=Melia azedarach TaxID=155640 RepID=A0ACC1YCW6_MELAZ|nr:Bidirectional sugar transporter SWEET [Melia azedarach]